MAKDKTKIISSYGTVLMSDVGGEPSDLGYTRGGVSITKSYDTRNVEADQTRYPLYIQPTAEGYAIHFALLEITCAHLREVFGEAAEVEVASLSLGKYSDNPIEKEIIVYAKRKDDKYVKFTFYRCILTGCDSMEATKDGEVLNGATFSATFDDTNQCIGLMEEVDSP
jgi:hypothetical protein